MSQTLEQIRVKFTNNIIQIEKHIEYIESFFLATFKMNNDLNQLSPTFYRDQTIDNICSNTSVIKEEIETYIHSLQTKLDLIPIKEHNPNDPSYEDDTPDGDILLYLSTEIHKGISSKEKLFSEAMSILESLCITKGDLIGGERLIQLYENPTELNNLIDIAINDYNVRRATGLQNTISFIKHSSQALDLFDPNNHLNIYRQGFIQVMAFFDCCVFELVESCMENDLFNWISYFSNQSIKTHEMAKHGSLVNFQSELIKSILKNCYVKDLIKIIIEKDKNIFIHNGQDIQKIILEKISRRNAHIHHNGNADNIYLKDHNIYSFSENDYLLIDKTYFNETKCFTTKIVENIANKR